MLLRQVHVMEGFDAVLAVRAVQVLADALLQRLFNSVEAFGALGELGSLAGQVQRDLAPVEFAELVRSYNFVVRGDSCAAIACALSIVPPFSR